MHVEGKKLSKDYERGCTSMSSARVKLHLFASDDGMDLIRGLKWTESIEMNEVNGCTLE